MSGWAAGTARSGQGHRASRGSRWARCAACVLGALPSCRSAGGDKRQSGSSRARVSSVHARVFPASASRHDACWVDLSLVQGSGGSLHPVASVFLSVLVPVFSSDPSALTRRRAGGTGLFISSQTWPERAVWSVPGPGCPSDAFCSQCTVGRGSPLLQGGRAASTDSVGWTGCPRGSWGSPDWFLIWVVRRWLPGLCCCCAYRDRRLWGRGWPRSWPSHERPGPPCR